MRLRHRLETLPDFLNQIHKTLHSALTPLYGSDSTLTVLAFQRQPLSPPSSNSPPRNSKCLPKPAPSSPTEQTLVRADISRLPFATSSVDAVHAGAALHCWPSPSGAVAEISRVLRPGGVFVATTYILDGPFAFLPFLREGTKV